MKLHGAIKEVLLLLFMIPFIALCAIGEGLIKGGEWMLAKLIRR